jgi:hypothetical protein
MEGEGAAAGAQTLVHHQLLQRCSSGHGREGVRELLMQHLVVLAMAKQPRECIIMATAITNYEDAQRCWQGVFLW